MTTESAATPKPASASSEPTPEEIELARERLRPEQSLMRGALLGLAAALGGAMAWALVTALTHYQIGFMAIGVGYIVGHGVRIGGRGFDTIFSITGAALALLGCMVGNVLAGVAFVAANEEMSYLDALLGMDIGIAIDLLVAMFSPMDLLFYGLAVYEGYRLSLRRLTVEDVRRALGHAQPVPTAG